MSPSTLGEMTAGQPRFQNSLCWSISTFATSLASFGVDARIDSQTFDFLGLVPFKHPASWCVYDDDFEVWHGSLSYAGPGESISSSDKPMSYSESNWPIDKTYLSER